MTTVLSPFDTLMRPQPSMVNGKMELADEPLSNEDWKTKYEEVCETLADTEADLAEFQVSSKELEEEMGLELERAEKAKEEMRNKLSKAETERDDWKNKFMNLQTTHTKTVNSLQRELEALRESFQMTKIQLRDLEMGNDDLERHERAVLSSLEDLEGKYARALEEKILLEHELQDKASMEETLQRLRDELRDTTSEVSVLKEKLERTAEAPAVPITPLEADLQLILGSERSVATPEPLLEEPLPSDDLQLSDLEPRTPINPEPESEITTGRSALLARAGFASPATVTAMSRPGVLPSSPSRLPAPALRRPLVTNITNAALTSPTIRSNGNRTASNATTTSAVAARSKGMQMVSDMRSRVKTLEQRIQSRVPRIRKPSMRLGDLDGVRRDSGEQDRSVVESPGWVLVTQEASPSKPRKDNGASSPPPSSFRPGISTSALRPPSGSSNSLSASQVHLSASTSSRCVSRTGRTNSPVPQHGTRSVTPTHLPIPTEASKQPTRRSSLSTSLRPHASSRARPPSTSMPPRPPLPPMHTPPPAAPAPLPAGRGSQLPMRSGSSLGMSTRNALSMSKIGRPSSLTAPPRGSSAADE